MDIFTLLVVGMVAILVLGGAGSMIVPGAAELLRRLWYLLTPPPM